MVVGIPPREASDRLVIFQVCDILNSETQKLLIKLFRLNLMIFGGNFKHIQVVKISLDFLSLIIRLLQISRKNSICYRNCISYIMQ